MAKIKVNIEEHLCKTVKIEVPDNLDEDEQEELAENIAHDMYNDGRITLTADDYTGVTLCSLEHSNGESTDWFEW